MKLSKYIMTLSGIAALGLASVGCVESIDYQPGAESHGLYYPLDAAPQAVLGDAGTFEVTVARTGNLAAASYAVTSTADPALFTVAPQVTFADGALTAKYAVTYDPAKIEAGKFYDVQFGFGDGVEVNNYGYSTMDYRLLKPITEWTDYGTGTFYNDIAAGVFNNVKLQWMRNFDRTDYRFVDLLGEGLPLDIYYDEAQKRFFCPRQVVYAAGTQLAASYGDIYAIDNYTWWTTNEEVSDVRACAYAESEFIEEEGMMALNLAYGVQNLPGTPYGLGFCYFVLDGVGEWSQFVQCSFKDGWIMPRLIKDYDKTATSYPVYIQQHKTDKNRYRLVNIYKGAYDNVGGTPFGNPTLFNYNTSNGFDFVEFTTADPEYICFPRQFSGFTSELTQQFYIGDEQYEIGDYAGVFGTEGKEQGIADGLATTMSRRRVITIPYPAFNGRERMFDEGVDLSQVKDEAELGDVIFGLVLPVDERSTCTLTLPSAFGAPEAREPKALHGATIKPAAY